ncbi:MAG: CDGSH iron-sulfur domain-containing protein [Thermoleophilia bacterium]|nr:CDGSH iron-sulfur domain-containing protein [Thermoleophilia bacterium]
MSEPGPLIKVRVNGSYLVSGGVSIEDAAGRPLEAGEPYALCRCGGSASKPFCDGSHKRRGFDGTETADREPRGEPADEPPRIVVSKDGPYLVSGGIPLVSADGTPYGARASYALCRCGGSAGKPFCDGTHRTRGFRAG